MAFSCASSNLHCYVELVKNADSNSTQLLKGNLFLKQKSSLYPKNKQWIVRISNELQPPIKTDITAATIPAPFKEGEAIDSSSKKEPEIPESKYNPELENSNGGMDNIDRSGSNGRFGNGGGNGNDGGGGDDEKNEDDEFGPILSFEQVMKEAEARGVKLPSDMLDAAKAFGIQELLLFRYLDMQASSWPLGAAIKSCPLLRNRMLVDPSFLFKIGTEIIIDTCCATFAEVQKRGEEFWSEFELYAADMLVGVVVNVALVGMLAPYARFGRAAASEGLLGRIRHAYDALPSSVFEAERPGCRFSIQQRIGTYPFKGILYGAVGFFCGLLGQGIANLIMTAKRSVKKSEEDVPIPPLFKSAALWGAFLAVSSNTRYQIINGMERLVEASPVAKRIPTAALAFTVGVRFANNVFGGMQFVEWARLTGCQ